MIHYCVCLRQFRIRRSKETRFGGNLEHKIWPNLWHNHWFMSKNVQYQDVSAAKQAMHPATTAHLAHTAYLGSSSHPSLMIHAEPLEVCVCSWLYRGTYDNTYTSANQNVQFEILRCIFSTKMLIPYINLLIFVWPPKRLMRHFFDLIYHSI